MKLFAELVPLEVRPVFRQASDDLKRLQESLAWEGLMLEEQYIALLHEELVRVRGVVVKLLGAYPRGDVTLDAVTAELREAMDPEAVVVRAGLAEALEKMAK